MLSTPKKPPKPQNPEMLTYTFTLPPEAEGYGLPPAFFYSVPTREAVERVTDLRTSDITRAEYDALLRLSALKDAMEAHWSCTEKRPVVTLEYIRAIVPVTVTCNGQPLPPLAVKQVGKKWFEDRLACLHKSHKSPQPIHESFYKNGVKAYA